MTTDLPELWTHRPHHHLQFKPGDLIADLDPGSTPGFRGKKADAPALQEERNAVYSELQEMLYANSLSGYRRSILLILQGIDTAGKGGVVKHVVGAANPQGIWYANFGKPTEEELSHHFLWRISKKLPPAGHIGVFDRSHYEDVLIVRVHDLVPPDVWEGRYDEINAFEKELVDAGTTIIKVAMFVSLDEQKKRLQERLDRPEKYWKFDPADIDERMMWPAYQEAYQAVLDRTSTDHAPWYVIPANSKWYSRLAITELLIETLTGFNLSWPPASFDVNTEKRRLAKA